MVFVNNVTYIESLNWSQAPEGRMEEIRHFYEAAVNGLEGVHDGYSGSVKGFGSLEGWARASGITRYPDAKGELGLAIRLVLVPKDSSYGCWVDSPSGKVPIIGLGVGDTTSLEEAYHELAHILDGPEDYWSKRMAAAVGVQRYRGYDGSSPGEGRTDVAAHGNFPTSYAETNHREDFADSVMVYFLGNPEVGYENWADDGSEYQGIYGELADARWYPADRTDRYDYVEWIFGRDLGPAQVISHTDSTEAYYPPSD
jgi:hypothetical protein